MTDRIATRNAKRSEFRKRTGRVAGMVMEKALDQLLSVRYPSLATGEPDQKLPKTRAQIGRKTINPTTTVKIRDIPLAAVELYTDGSHGLVPDLFSMTGNLLGRRKLTAEPQALADSDIEKTDEKGRIRRPSCRFRARDARVM